jgi:thiol-disulfide isomerase/thioredoxin
MKNTIRKIASSWYDANGKLKLPRLYDSNFDNLDIKKHKGKSIVIFSADWCPYCLSFFNNWKDYGSIESVFIADITDVDSNLWDIFDVNVVPTMAIFKEGKLEKRWDGILGQGITINQIEDANSSFSEL